MSKGIGLAAAVGVAVGYAAREANVFDGVVREGGVVDFGRLGANLKGVADTVLERVSASCPPQGKEGAARKGGEDESRES